MSLHKLPNESLFTICDHLDRYSDINAWARSNKKLYWRLNSYLYRLDVRQTRSSALVWAAIHGLKRTAWLSLAESANTEALHMVTVPRSLRCLGFDSGPTYLTPLQISLCYGSDTVARLLIDFGATSSSPYPSELYGCTNLHMASAVGPTSTVKTLIAQGMSIEARDTQLRTPLHYAVIMQHVDAREHGRTVMWLLANKADPNTEDTQRKCPAFIGRKNSNALVRMLFKKGAEIAAYDALLQDQDILEVRRLLRGKQEEEAWAKENREQQLVCERASCAIAKRERCREMVKKKRILADQRAEIATSREREEMSKKSDARKKTEHRARVRSDKLAFAQEKVEKERAIEKVRVDKHDAVRESWSRMRKQADWKRPVTTSMDLRTQSDCRHLSGLWKSKVRKSCQACGTAAKSLSFCPDCGSILCKQCSLEGRQV